MASGAAASAHNGLTGFRPEETVQLPLGSLVYVDDYIMVNDGLIRRETNSLLIHRTEMLLQSFHSPPKIGSVIMCCREDTRICHQHLDGFPCFILAQCAQCFLEWGENARRFQLGHTGLSISGALLIRSTRDGIALF